MVANGNKKANKTAVVKKAAEKKVAPVVEKKAESKAEPKPKFDAKAYSAEILKAFKGNKNVDVVVDTELAKGPRDTTQPEYAYIHFFKKGTEKDLFKMYNMAKGSRFAISRAVYESKKIADAKPVIKKTKKGEQVVSYANVVVAPDKAVETANRIIETYMSLA